MQTIPFFHNIASPVRETSHLDNQKLSIRFEEKKDTHIWIPPKDIIFVKSADHYIRTFVLHNTVKKWAIRHCTIKDILGLLPDKDFIRLNRFYVLNLNYYSHANDDHKTIYLQDGITLPVPHRISPFIIQMLKN